MVSDESGETVEEWFDKNCDRSSDKPDSEDYLEVVERAERASKQVESVDNITSQKSKSLGLRTES